MYPLKIKEKYSGKDLESVGHRFTVPYLGNYKEGNYKEDTGSHPGVDIVPEIPNQDVFCVLDGTVEKVGEDGAYGNYVFIKHFGVGDYDDMSKKVDLVSCYLHLKEVKVEKGDMLKEGHIIGKTGNTGISFGEHLHFQIDRADAPFYGYWPYTGAEAIDAGVSFSEGVNISLGKENVKKYTVNPLKYLDKIAENKEEKIEEEVKVAVVDTPVTPVEPVVEKVVESEEKIIETTTDIELESIITDMPVEIPTISSPTLGREEVVVSTPEIVDVDLTGPDLASGDVIISSKGAFGDIGKNNEYYNYISQLHNEGLISGYDDGTFRPNNLITRGEFLKVILGIKKVPLSSDSNNYFKDLNDSMWQKKYVNTAVELGLISKKNQVFRPNDNISRVEALKISILLFVGEVYDTYTQNFVDIDKNLWYASFVEYAVKNRLLDYDSNFYPDKNISRIELIQICANIIK